MNDLATYRDLYEGQSLQRRYKAAMATSVHASDAARQVAREELQVILEEVELHPTITTRARQKIKDLR